MVQFKVKAEELEHRAREERDKMMLQYAKKNPNKTDTIILIDYIMESFENVLTRIEREREAAP